MSVTTSSISDFDFKKYTILIVDDHPYSLEILSNTLTRAGFQIAVAIDAKGVFEQIRSHRPELILLDIMMPGMDGFEICKRLKEDSSTFNIPIIFMTALSDFESKIEGFSLGAVDYITKPFQQEEVLARVKVQLMLCNLTQTLEKQNKILEREILQRENAEASLIKVNQELEIRVNERTLKLSLAIKRIRQAQIQLVRQKQELETEVKKRTIKLHQINQQLQQEIIERKQAEEQIKISLKEKEILLKEIHHRVKNNLLVVASLLEFQAGYVEELETIKMFEDSQRRIYSMALIHEQLYYSHNLGKLDFSQYLKALVDKLAESYDLSEHNIQLLIDAESIDLNIETAHPCGLIVNELIANSFEHAFPEKRKGNIWLTMHRNQEHQITLIVKDDGIGFPTDLNFQNTESLGLQLVCTLTKQLEGTIDLNWSNGTCFQITFAELNYCKRI
ncbi:response regulator [Pleurocapsales cyanobacterium LEGE 06147]|nr:response regulator [Pleurocapsales cyanobacterium LEGE 06147]